MAKSAMGKGLGSILGDDDSDYIGMQAPISEENKNFRKISLDRIDANPDQPRKEFSAEALEELSNSILRNGVIQPILVEKKPLNRYLIIAGERRYRASKKAGLSEIPAVIKDDLSEEQILELALIENIQRENLSPMEEAYAYKKIMETSSLSQEEVAKKVGKNRSSVANSVRLLKLPKLMQDAVNEGKLSFGHARNLLSVMNPSDQKLLFSIILKDGISVREAEKLAQLYNQGKKGHINSGKSTSAPKPYTPSDPEIMNIQNNLMTTFGTKVGVKGDLEKGKIEIDYYSLDDLKRIYDLIVKE